MKPLFVATICLYLACFSLLAHSDPRGDVHPIVSVEGSNFIVRASSNIVENETVLFVFLADGTPKQERRQLSRPPEHVPYQEYSLIDRLPEEHNGLERPWGGGTIIIPEWSRKHGGRPFIIEYKNDEFKFHGLSWTNPDVYEVIDALVVKDDLYLLVSRFTASNDPQLFFHRFSLKTFSEDSSVELPRPCRIWSFPVCSNIIEHEGALYAGIVVPRFFGYSLLLVDWNGKDPFYSQRVLTNKIDWNTSVSLANIGKDALIAYHYPGEYPKWPFYKNPPISKIKTIPFKIK